MTTSKQKVDDVRVAVFWIAGSVALFTLAFTSGFNVDLVNAAIGTAGGGSAGPDEFFSVFDVAFRAFPLVAAILASAALIRYTSVRGYPLFVPLALLWVVAAVLAAGGEPVVAATSVFGAGGPPHIIFLRAVGETVQVYTPLLVGQAVVVAGGTIAAFLWLEERWRVEADE